MTLVILCLTALVCMALTSAVYKKFWNRGLSAQVTFAREQIDEGQSVLLQEKIENRKILPLPTLTVKFQLDRSIHYRNTENTNRTDKQYRNDCISVMPYQRVTRSLEIIGTKRGFYSVDEIGLVAFDLLYRQNLMEHLPNRAWLYVYPARSKFRGFSELFERMYGEILTNRRLWEDPFEFKGIRDYTASDPMRKVNWKASARTGSLKVNQFYDTSSRQLTIFLNVEQTGVLKYEDLIEESIRVTRNFLEEFIRKGIPVTLFSNGVDKMTGEEIRLREGTGMEHIDSCLKQLARMEISGKIRSMTSLLEEQANRSASLTGNVSLLISAEQSAQLAEAYLKYAKDQGSANWLIPIHAATERYISENIGEETLRGEKGNRIHTEYMIMEQYL